MAGTTKDAGSAPSPRSSRAGGRPAGEGPAKKTAKKAPARKTVKKTAKKTPARKTPARAPIDTGAVGWALNLPPDRWGEFLLSGELSPAILAELARLRRPPAQASTVAIQADLRAALDAYLADHGAQVRDVVQASLAAFLGARGYFPPPAK